MPELVEVEHFRHLLLPLVNKKKSAFDEYDEQVDGNTNQNNLFLECPSLTPPKKFPPKSELKAMNNKYQVRDVERKGKLLRLVLESVLKEEKPGVDKNLYLYLHMGMTGRISTQDYVPALESLSGEESYPPPHTHLILKCNEYEAAFSDPRRFGAITIGSEDGSLHASWNELAPDALLNQCTQAYDRLVGNTKGIKAILLDQKAVISGIGNWIADEVLYQSRIHPDQNHLSVSEVEVLKQSIQYVLKKANQCMNERREFPKEWIFHYRWSKASSKRTQLKDYDGRNVSFLQSGGRSTAIVPSLQKKMSREKEIKKIASCVRRKKSKLVKVKEENNSDVKKQRFTGNKREEHELELICKSENSFGVRRSKRLNKA